MSNTDWKNTLETSAKKADLGVKYKKQAGELLWVGAQGAVEDWLTQSDTDVHAEALYADILDAMGTHRKGDASKIKTVALAVKSKGLVLAQFDNLGRAYAEANRLTKVVKAQAEEDNAADERVQEIATDAPKSSSKPEGAVLIVLAQGVDEAAKLLVDALVGEGPQADLSAARAMLRALAEEITGRVPKPEPKPKAEKKAPAKKASPKAEVKSGAAKPKPVKKAAAPAPVVEDEPTGEDLDDLLDSIGDEPDADETVTDDVTEVEVAVPVAKKKATPVRRGGPVRR